MECQGQEAQTGISSPERSLRMHRCVVDSGTPSESVISSLPWFFAAILSMVKSSSEERTLLVVRMHVNTRLLRHVSLWCIDVVS